MYMEAYKYVKEQLDNGSFTDSADFAKLPQRHCFAIWKSLIHIRMTLFLLLYLSLETQ